MSDFGTPQQERAFAAEFVRGVSRETRSGVVASDELIALVCDVLDMIAERIASGEHIMKVTS